MLSVVLSVINDPDDRNFMECLYINYKRLMYSEIYKILGEDNATDDILQESLIKLIDKIPLLRTLDKPRRINYIISTVRNMSMNYFRKQSKGFIYSLDDTDTNIANTISDGTNIEDNIIFCYEKQNFEKAWAKLDETNRALLEGKYILEKNDAELGEVFGVKPSSVRMMLTRARHKAMELMTEELSILNT